MAQDGQKWVDVKSSAVMVIKLCLIRGLLEKYPTFGQEKETGLPAALAT